MSDVKLLVGILEKIANICKDNMLECKKEVNFDNKYLTTTNLMELQPFPRKWE